MKSARGLWVVTLAVWSLAVAVSDAGPLVPPKRGERFWYCATATYAAVAIEVQWEMSNRAAVRVIRFGGPEVIRVDPPISLRSEVDELACGADRLQVRMGQNVQQVAIGEAEPRLEASGALSPRAENEDRGLLRAGRIYRVPGKAFALTFLRASRAEGPSDAEEAIALIAIGNGQERLVFMRQWEPIVLD